VCVCSSPVIEFAWIGHPARPVRRRSLSPGVTRGT